MYPQLSDIAFDHFDLFEAFEDDATSIDEDKLLFTEIAVPASNENDDEDRVNDDDDLDCDLYSEEEYQKVAPESPQPNAEAAAVNRISSIPITPDTTFPRENTAPSIVELQFEYQRTLQKLAKSMRRSDETRSIVKRQRLSYNFFQTTRCEQLEDTRQKVLQVVLAKDGDMRVATA